MYEHIIEFQIRGPVCTIVMTRPEKRNAVDRHMAGALRDAFLRFEADDTLRVAVLTAAGNTFCAGADLPAIGDSEKMNELDPDGGGMGPMGPFRASGASVLPSSAASRCSRTLSNSSSSESKENPHAQIRCDSPTAIPQAGHPFDVI